MSYTTEMHSEHAEERQLARSQKWEAERGEEKEEEEEEENEGCRSAGPRDPPNTLNHPIVTTPLELSRAADYTL